MKKKFLDWSLSIIKKHNNIDETRLAELRYGLEGFYLSITKAVLIFSLAYILNVFGEMLLLLMVFNILRSTGFGLHASKSWICLLFSSTAFIIPPLFSNIIIIPFLIKFILGIISIILIFVYAPADTIKRPLVNAKKRSIFKIITTVNCIILVIISLIIKNEAISNLIIFGVYIEIGMILPIIYKFFKLSYNNYKGYVMD